MDKIYRTAKERFDLRLPGREHVRVTCVTAGMETHHDYLYMETPVFSGDGNRFVFRQPAKDYHKNLNTVGRNTSADAYWMCDIADNYACVKICDEPGVKGGSMDYKGEYFYYVSDDADNDRIVFLRLNIQTLKKDTISVIDTPPAGCVAVPSRVYPIAAVRRDGKKYCTGAYLADSRYENGPWGVLVFDTGGGGLDIILEGEDFCNPHPQYAKNADIQNDLLIQHNHGSFINKDYAFAPLVSGFGADIHVIRDDGADMRTLPWGRDGNERCQGHQAWRGELKSAVTSTSTDTGRPGEPARYTLIESEPVRCEENLRHKGLRVQGGRRRELSAGIENPGFVHFAFSLDGQKFVSDFVRRDLKHDDPDNVRIVIARIRDNEPAPMRGMTEIVKTLTVWDGAQMSHPHPFLSPDCKKVLFNAYVGGRPQIHIAEGFDFDAL